MGARRDQNDLGAAGRQIALRARRAMVEMATGRRRRRPRKVKRQRFPREIQLEYQRAILELVREAQDAIRDDVLPGVRRLIDISRQTDPSARQDAPADELELAIDQVIARVVRAQQARRAAIAGNAVRRTADQNRRELDRIFEDFLGVGLPAAEPYLADFAAAAVRENVRRITSLVQSEFDEAENVILSGFRRGLRFEEVARQLEDRFNIIENRAKLIARDQITSLNGELNRLRQTNMGVESYIWRDSNDDRVREAHEELDGERFTWAEGSPEGHPGEPINCFPGDTAIAVPDAAVRLFRRWYEGELVVVQTKAGTLRCTPNHPVLTRRGWRFAKQLDEGDHVVHATLDPSGLGDDDRYQASFDQVWNLARGVGLRYTRAGRFHGDASPDDQVDVVDVHRNLSVDRPSLCADCLEQLALAQSDETRAAAGLLQSSGAAPRLAANGSVSSSNAGGALGSGQPPLHCKHCLGAAPRFTTPLAQPAREHIPRDADLARERLHRLPLGVSFHQLTEAPGRVEFRGHVFNLESVGHWYVAATTIVHNCRCIAEPVLRDLVDATDPTFV